MDPSNSDLSTRELIAEAEALRGKKGAGRDKATRQLVREAERLIGRKPAKRAVSPALVLVALALIAAAVAAYLGFFG